MDIGGAVRIEYWAEADGKIGVFEPEGMSEFKAELAANYVSQVRGRPGAMGGLYGLSVDFLTSFSLRHFLSLIMDGIAYDLVKSGSEALILRPFIAAYKALKKRNNERFITGLRIERLSLSFEDSTVIIHELRNVELVSNLEPILYTLASHYKNLILRSGEEPSLISVPVVEDPADDRLSRFREFLDVDETVQDISALRYLGFWGLRYDFANTSRVYDVEKQLLLDLPFLTQSAYWKEWERRWKEQNP